jgi:hypothetical protein
VIGEYFCVFVSEETGIFLAQMFTSRNKISLTHIISPG